jgi:hypothetical protein
MIHPEEYDSDLHGRCGVYCGACRIYCATRDKDQKFIEKFIKKLIGGYEGMGLEKISEEDVQCEGCRSENVSIVCRTCSVRDCTQEKGYSGCHECDDFPCQFIKEIISSNFRRDLH